MEPRDAKRPKDISPLAPKLEQQAIQQMPVDGRQNDSHFIEAIIHYAEHKSYHEDVVPSVEFGFIIEDVAKVGVPATLLVLINDVKVIQCADFVAPCHVGCSEGKGFGFEAVCMISETPMIFGDYLSSTSPPRLVQTGQASGPAGKTPVVDHYPTRAALLSACGRQTLPTTVIVLPIRDGKMGLVMEQLQKLSPESVLFLKQIRMIEAWVHVQGKPRQHTVRIARSKSTSTITSNVCEFFAVDLRVTRELKLENSYTYFVLEKSYPVTQPVEEEHAQIPEWTITLAFPKDLERTPAGDTGEVFSFAPTEIHTGFPFLIAAGFMVSPSRSRTIRFDSNWKPGILNCIPDAYRTAFQIMQRNRSALETDGIVLHSDFELLNPKDAWKYLPTDTGDNAFRYYASGHKQDQQNPHTQPHLATNIVDLEKVRAEILRLCAPPKHWRQVKPSFRHILAQSAGKPNNESFEAVEEYIQERYGSKLSALGVQEMTADQYKSFVVDNSKWLLELPETDYLEVLSFFAFEINLSESISRNSFLKDARLLKVRGRIGSVELVSLHQLGEGTTLLYTYPEHVGAEDAAWISEWVVEFSPWLPAKVMPAETSQALLMASDSDALASWIQETYGSLTQLSIHDYCDKLISKLSTICAERSNAYSVTSSDSERPFPVLVLQFLYSAIRKGLVIESEVRNWLRGLGNVTVLDSLAQVRGASFEDGSDFELLLPQNASEWQLLHFPSRAHANHFIVLSGMYLEPQSSLVVEVTRAPGPGSMLTFLKDALNAGDLPDANLQSDKEFHFVNPVTMETSQLTVQWLKVLLTSRPTKKSEQETDRLLQNLKKSGWMKTLRHGWQPPPKIFCSKSYDNYFHEGDLPCLDVSAYSLLNLTDPGTQLVFDQLEIVTDMDKGGAVAVDHFSKCLAWELNQEAVERLYAYLHCLGWNQDTTHTLKIWTPAADDSTVPVWRSPMECVVRDEHSLFSENSLDITVLDKIYPESLLPFFSETLRVPKRPPVDMYCRVWLKWCGDQKTGGQQLADQQQAGYASKFSAQCVWQYIMANQHECSKGVWELLLSKASISFS